MRPDKLTILVPCGDSHCLNAVLEYALPVADVFNASLTFFFIGNNEGFITFTQNIKQSTPDYIFDNRLRFIPCFSVTNGLTVIEKNEINEEVMMVIFPEMPGGNLNFFREMSFMFRTRKLRLPFMVLHAATEFVWKPENVVIPVGYDRDDKETALWASYFARFNQSKITVLFAREKEQWAHNYTKNNVLFIKNLFNELGINPTIREAETGSGNLPEEAIKLAHCIKNSLVMLSTTRYYSIEHYFIGPKELKIIKNKEKVPVLCVNPRKDNYVLCK